ncbi:hypothetical protein Nepgr_017899 [Nepenthes gracilis]|uniref:Uncharacterized protein n=1 Tax=Nepenthes gracilis TaxID=150966 RepID=A0AAD3SRC3_NEPGR|nr:hypothetical protein Nepgr_017899 [Nepenthes gracilis]
MLESAVMKVCNKPMLAFVLALIMVYWFNGAKGRPLLLRRALSSSESSASQALRDLRSRKKDPFVKVDSSFREIPTSSSNPTQNK